MNELGIDILNGSKVIIAKERVNKPMDSCGESKNIVQGEYNIDCPFCRGNESMVPEETFIIEEDNNWVSKSVINKYPILDDDISNQLYGRHEVMVETYRHDGNFYNMKNNEFYNMFIMYKDRYESLMDERGIKYVCIFKNYLRQAGASLMHPHSQIISLPLIPPELEREYEICRDYYEKMGINMYEHIISQEIKEDKRVIYNSDEFLVFMPQVSRFVGETIILLKNNKYFEEIKNDELKELSYIFETYFKNMYKENGNCPFNIYIHTHPLNEGEMYKKTFNIHIHIVPRKFNLGGFELSTGFYVSCGNVEEIIKKLKFK